MSGQGRPWHDRHMTAVHPEIALALSRQHVMAPRLLFHAVADAEEACRWRWAMRSAGVPLLELNDAVGDAATDWLQAASDFSAEFHVPVAVFGHSMPERMNLVPLDTEALTGGRTIEDAEWLRTRQVALTRAVETSGLNQECRRSHERKGWIRIGWQPEDVLVVGNGLQLAWSSPLPLRRIRDFAARCPEITLLGPDAEAIAAEVAAQGISVSGWRFAVK